jgi:hypothetical protein
MKYLEKTVVILLGIIVIFSVFYNITKTQDYKEEIEITKILYNNILAENDSLREISENLYVKLSKINYEDSLSIIEKDQLKKELDGKTKQIVNLEMRLKSIEEGIVIFEPDDSFVFDTSETTENIIQPFYYSFEKNYKDYSIKGKIGVFSIQKPDSTSIEINTQFSPINIDIYTKQVGEYSYEIYVNTSSNFITLTNAFSYITVDRPETKINLLKKFDAGLGIGMMNDGVAFVSGNLKYSHHNFGLLYSGSNGRFGAQYVYFFKK